MSDAEKLARLEKIVEQQQAEIQQLKKDRDLLLQVLRRNQGQLEILRAKVFNGGNDLN